VESMVKANGKAKHQVYQTPPAFSINRVRCGTRAGVTEDVTRSVTRVTLSIAIARFGPPSVAV